MEIKHRVLVTAEKSYTKVPGFDLCCDECGGLCRDLVELLSPSERGRLISEFKAARRSQIASGELQRSVVGYLA